MNIAHAGIVMSFTYIVSVQPTYSPVTPRHQGFVLSGER